MATALASSSDEEESSCCSMNGKIVERWTSIQSSLFETRRVRLVGVDERYMPLPSAV